MPTNEWTKEEIGSLLEYANDDTIIVPDCNDFIIGMTTSCQLVYDWRAIIADLQLKNDWKLGEAMEWFDNNIDIYPSGNSPSFQDFFIVDVKKRDKFRKTYGKNVGAVLI
jgi:hypothetical protein